MEEKILLSNGKEEAIAFQKSVKDVVTRSNELIGYWLKWQEFSKITTLDDFLVLVKDPVERMNQLLISSVDISIAGDKTKISARALAPMLSIDYESWLNLVAGKTISETCVPCKKTRIRKGQKVITFEEYWYYSNFVKFESGKFLVTQEAVEEHQKSFATYTTSAQQNEVHAFWTNCCDFLNELNKRGYFGMTALMNLQKDLQDHKMYSHGDNQLHVNQDLLMKEVLKTQ